jgi:MFS superfamily sulfate permease-like transporter
MQNNNNPFKNLRSDFPASIVVFLVAVPLCLGIALASGAPLFSGIIAGIVGGIVVTAFSGSPLGVSGPAAGLAVIVLGAISELGSFPIFLLAVVIGGVIQIILGLAKAGIIGYYFPSSVIRGMLSGIGIIIILKQIPHAFGYDKDPEGDWEFFQADGHTTFSDLYYMLDVISPGAIVISVISLLILILWERPLLKKFKFTQVIQGPLVVVIVGILLNLLFQAMPQFVLKSDQVVNIPVAGSWSEFLALFTHPDFSQIFNKEVYVIGATIAVVASLETLLCVEATDKLDPQKRITPTNRELIAQGIGNITSGMIGGLPITQVIVRSSANIQSGGRTKASAFLHGVLILISALLIPGVLNLIPLASLAAILFIVGYKLAKPATFKQVYKQGISQFLPFIITIVGIVFTDLLIGISLGLVTGVMYILWNNYRTPYHFEPEQYKSGEPINIELSEDVSFLNKAGIMNTLNHLPENSRVVIDASRAKNIHVDIMEIFEDFRLNAQSKNIDFSVVGLNSKKKEDPVKKFKSTV